MPAAVPVQIRSTLENFDIERSITSTYFGLCTALLWQIGGGGGLEVGTMGCSCALQASGPCGMLPVASGIARSQNSVQSQDCTATQNSKLLRNPGIAKAMRGWSTQELQSWDCSTTKGRLRNPGIVELQSQSQVFAIPGKGASCLVTTVWILQSTWRGSASVSGPS